MQVDKLVLPQVQGQGPWEGVSVGPEVMCRDCLARTWTADD